MSIKSLDKRMPIFVTLTLLLIGHFSLAKQPVYQTQAKKFADSSETLSRWELRTAPVALLARWYTLDVSYRISEKWATGPAAVIYGSGEIGNMFAPSYKGYAAGWSANYYFNSVLKSGWYLSMHSYYEKYSSYPHAYLGHKELDGFRANAVAGYQWKWSAINLMVGLGSEYRNHNVTDKPEAIGEYQPEVSSFNETRTLPHIEFKIGTQL